MEEPGPIFFDQFLETPAFVGSCLHCSSLAPDCVASTGLLFLLSRMRVLSGLWATLFQMDTTLFYLRLIPVRSLPRCPVISHGHQSPTISLPICLRLHELKTGVLDGLGRDGLSSEPSSPWPPTQPCFTSPDTPWAVLVIKERCPLVSGQKD